MAVNDNATAVMNPMSQMSLEETFAQTTVLATLKYQGGSVLNIPGFRKISDMVWEEQIRLGLLFMVQHWTFCVDRLLEDSPVELPHQLPYIEV